MLYGPASQPTVVDETVPSKEEIDPTDGELRLGTRTGSADKPKAGFPLAKLAVILGLVIVLAAVGWVLLPNVVGPQEVTHTLQVVSEPPGAAIIINGQDRGLTTGPNGRVDIPLEGLEGDSFTIELHREGYTSASTVLTLGTEPPTPIELSLEPLPIKMEIVTQPPGASVELDGRALPGTRPFDIELDPREDHQLIVTKDEYVSQRLNIAAGEAIPSDEIVLTPVTKPGTLVVTSAYPLSVLSAGGSTLAEGPDNLSIRMGPGRHQITIYAPQVFLNHSFTVEIREARQTPLKAPALGKVSIRAQPGNCQVTINGVPAEALPIDNKDIVAGTNTFVFEWPGGRRDEQVHEVRAGGHAYVIGKP